ncbi:hypothetical protein [Allostreptomyces psammosilenae]|uniref:Uncharacterized protein n=1 Tax=Allostreptomyces psammosilenae TaxID=1892865 RepID=A0A852ZXZ7_9ACTN|nr:hypothetical protein [Allostreptomyces psammosilenae]NYI06657.1 hypothetical protein [Allostreptomyces psammosilenae]
MEHDTAHAPDTALLLVLADRDDAEELAHEVAARHPGLPAPRVVREYLAGEDDAEDAQWLVVLEDPAGHLTAEDVAALRERVAEYEGWLEFD